MVIWSIYQKLILDYKSLTCKCAYTLSTMAISNAKLKVSTAVLVMKNTNRPHFFWVLKLYAIYLLLIVHIADSHHHSVFLAILSPIPIKVPPLFLRKPIVKEPQTFNQTGGLNAITSWCSLWLHYSLKF